MFAAVGSVLACAPVIRINKWLDLFELLEVKVTLAGSVPSAILAATTPPLAALIEVQPEGIVHEIADPACNKTSSNSPAAASVSVTECEVELLVCVPDVIAAIAGKAIGPTYQALLSVIVNELIVKAWPAVNVTESTIMSAAEVATVP